MFSIASQVYDKLVILHLSSSRAPKWHTNNSLPHSDAFIRTKGKGETETEGDRERQRERERSGGEVEVERWEVEREGRLTPAGLRTFPRISRPLNQRPLYVRPRSSQIRSALPSPLERQQPSGLLLPHNAAEDLADLVAFYQLNDNDRSANVKVAGNHDPFFACPLGPRETCLVWSTETTFLFHTKLG